MKANKALIAKEETFVERDKVALSPASHGVGNTDHASALTGNAKKKRKTAKDAASTTGENGADNEKMSASRKAGIKYRKRRKEIEGDLREKLAESYKDNAKLRRTNEQLHLEKEAHLKKKGHLLELIMKLSKELKGTESSERNGQNSTVVSCGMPASNNGLVPTIVSTHSSKRKNNSSVNFVQDRAAVNDPQVQRLNIGAMSIDFPILPPSSTSMQSSLIPVVGTHNTSRPAGNTSQIQQFLQQPWLALPAPTAISNGSHLLIGTPNNRNVYGSVFSLPSPNSYQF